MLQPERSNVRRFDPGLQPGEALCLVRAAFLELAQSPQAGTVTSLNLIGCRGLGDEDLSRLTQFPRLEALHLRATRIGDEGVEHIVQCRSLRALDLTGSQVGGSGIRRLAELPALRELRIMPIHFSGSRVAWEDLAALQAALPECRILFS